MLDGLKRFILWDYQRGVWQYDVICAVILAFMLLTPRDFFRDQPRIPQASQISSLPGQGEAVFWIEPGLVASVPEEKRKEALSQALTKRTGRKHTVTSIEAIYDDEHEIKGFMAFARP